ncbi:MAG: sodium:solute symporter family protein [Ruminococcaceae bacterium]|nr:sodium:solute symporter family protein [Oscillospiraceae bacterium]
MDLTLIIIITFVIFMAINIIIGLRGRAHASTTKDFLTAAGQSGIWMIIGSAVGASIGSGVVIGTTQYAVRLGVAGAWYAIACGLAGIVYAVVMSKFVYRNKLVSLSDYFKRRYSGNFIVLLYSGIGPFACAAAMGAQLVASKAIFQAFGMDPIIGLVITAAVMLVYTMFAGLWGSYATSVFQVIVIILGTLVVGVCMFTQGGIETVRAYYPQEMFNLFHITPELWMMFVGPMLLSVLVDQTSVQRVSSAKSEKVAFWGHFVSSVPLILFGLLMVYIGMWSGAEFPDAGGSAFIVLLMNKVPALVCALMLCAIIAAIMSTASGALVATDALVVHDLYCGFINKNATEAQRKRLNLLVNIVVSVAAVICAAAFENVIDLLSTGYTIMLSGTLVPLIGGLVWKRGTTKGAAAAAAVGMITAFLCIFKVISVPFSSIFPVVPAIVAYVIVSLCTKHSPSENTARVADVVAAAKEEATAE